VNELEQLKALAGDLHKSRLWKTGSVEQALAVILMGRELGVGPTTALSNITIAMGKPTLGYALVGALIQKSGRYGYRVLEMNDRQVSIEFYESTTLPATGGAGTRMLGVSTFTVEDAQRAGLLQQRGAGAWDKYLRNMLLARALTNGARWYCPGVFGGAVYDPEEFGLAGVPGTLPAPVPDEEPVDAIYTPSSNAGGVTIQALLERYSADQILAANGGDLPATDDELRAVAERLRADDEAAAPVG
jgi:hypothetical protein